MENMGKDLFENKTKPKKKIVEHNEYDSFLKMVFRKDNWIRLVGAMSVFLGKFGDVSNIVTQWVTVQSDILLIVFGLVTMILGPDLRKMFVNKFGISSTEGNT